jgi:hypothetical protein
MKLVTGHDKKLNFLKTGHQIDWSGWSWADHDQTGHKSLKTLVTKPYSNSYENVTLLLNLANFCEAFAKVCENLRKFAKVCENLRKFAKICENL